MFQRWLKSEFNSFQSWFGKEEKLKTSFFRSSIIVQSTDKCEQSWAKTRKLNKYFINFPPLSTFAYFSLCLVGTTNYSPFGVGCEIKALCCHYHSFFLHKLFMMNAEVKKSAWLLSNCLPSTLEPSWTNSKGFWIRLNWNFHWFFIFWLNIMWGILCFSHWIEIFRASSVFSTKFMRP